MRRSYKRVDAPAVLRDLNNGLVRYDTISQGVETVLKQIYEETGFPEEIATLASEISQLPDVSFFEEVANFLYRDKGKLLKLVNLINDFIKNGEKE